MLRGRIRLRVKINPFVTISLTTLLQIFHQKHFNMIYRPPNQFFPKALAALMFLILMTHVCWSQSVPADPILWLKADTGVIQENGHVAIWKDQSGNGNDAQMADTGSRPDLIIDSGRHAVIFHGWNYLQCPSIFPANADYTIAVVVKINNVNNVNNLVSGNVHALYLPNDLYPQVVHYWFQDQEVSPVPIWPTGFSAITASYDQAYQQATLFVNGQFADSSWILSTPDSTLYIGSYLGGYLLQGEIEEVLLYDRQLNPSERADLNSYLLNRYSIPTGIPPAKPDSTFSAIPNAFSLYPRGNDDSATVPIAGAIFQSGFDSIYLLQLKNDLPFSRVAQSLQYDSGHARFSFSPRIHAEMSEYRFEVHLVRGAQDTLLALRDSIACGDMFLMDGQGNAFNGFVLDTFRNEFCRTIGPRGSENLRDTNWFEADNDVGAADQRILQDLVSYNHLPCCSVNEAVGGTDIELHFRNDSDKYDLRTIYGRTLYRTTKSGMLSAVKVIYWLQGEANYAPGYYQKFLTLYNSWREDYPNLQKVYLLQNRPNGCDFGNIGMRDVQRAMGDSIPAVEPIASAALPDHFDGCHFNDDGYRFLGDRFYLEFARDFYHAADTTNLRSANAVGAWYSKPDHSQIAILFSPPDAQLHATGDTTIDGIFATLKDYLFPDDTSTHVESIDFDQDTLFVNFNKSSASQSIEFLTDQYYRGSDSVVYEGPWIVNSRGYGALLWYDLPITNAPLSVDANAKPISDAEIVPNPTSGIIAIDASELSGAVEATLISEAGEIILHQTFPSDHPRTLRFDLRNQSSGCYMLRLSEGNKTIERKFILEK